MELTNKTNRIKNWPMRALEFSLLIVSGWRTWDFINLIMAGLPGVEFYALLTVTISEGAYIIWSKAAYPNADPGPQESVSIGLIAFNTIGLLLLSFGENLMRATSGFSWAAIAANLLAFTPWAMLGINLLGALLFGILDDDHIDNKMKRANRRIDIRAENQLKHAETMAHIEAKQAAIAMLSSNQDELSRQLAPIYFNDIRDRVRNQTISNLGLGSGSPALPEEAPDFLSPKEPQNGKTKILVDGGNSHPKVKS